LPQSIPLNLWQRFFAKANCLKKETHHIPLDILFFLVRERSTSFYRTFESASISKLRVHLAFYYIVLD
jgi:hypothetical protein